MLFNSYVFVLFFLPFVILGYYGINRTGKYRCSSLFLLSCSLWFYAYTNVSWLPVIIGSILLNYLFYVLLKRGQAESESLVARKIILAVAVSANLGILFYLKYYNFFVDSLNLFFGMNLTIKNILLPMGISFMVFQQIAFAVDTYRGEITECGLLEYAVFVTFFPHLLSGPIIRHSDFFPLFRDEKRKRVDWDRMSAGIYMFAMGMGKKVLLADVFGRAVNAGYDMLPELNTVSAWFVSFAYTLQIYFDFSGYTDMAIGISRMLNLDLPANFNSPYKAKTIIEFWDRWHMTLTGFFTRYLYIPLGGSRKGKMRTWMNTMIVFLCSGLWHGAGWTYICWGFLHGIFLIVTKRFRSRIEKLPGAINRVVTLLFVNMTWILFRAESFGTARVMSGRLFSGSGGGLHTELCDFFQNPFISWISALPSWGMGCAYMAVGVLLTFGCPNAEMCVQRMKYNWKTGIFVAGILFLSLMSFSGITTYIYAGF